MTLPWSIAPSVAKTIISDSINAFFVDSFWNIAVGDVPPSDFADWISVHNLADEFQRTIWSNWVAWQILNSAFKTLLPIETNSVLVETELSINIPVVKSMWAIRL